MNYDSTSMRPKTIYVTFERQRNGKFLVKRVNLLKKSNQFSQKVERINKEDFARAINRFKVSAA